MAWMPNDPEIRAVLDLDGPERYEYCLKKIADEERLWSLRDACGWVSAGTDEGQRLFPVWPHEVFAALAATGPWQGSKPAPIDLDAWLSRWIPGMLKDGILVAVFPNAEGRGIPVEPGRFGADLREALSAHE